MDKPILFFTEVAENKDFGASLAHCCATPLRVLDGVHAPCGLQELKSATGVLFDLTSAAHPKHFEQISKLELNPNTTYVILSDESLDAFKDVFQQRTIGSVILKRQGGLSARDAKLVSVALKACNLERPFGLDKIFPQAGTIEALEFTDSKQKNFAASAVASYLQQVGCNERIIGSVASAVDELLMNAMYDAPMDHAGNRKHQKTSRSEMVETPGVELQMGSDGEIIAITVIDLIGSLKRQEILRQIGLNFGAEAQAHREHGLAGSGLGLTLTLRSGGSLFFACDPGKRTEVTVLFRNVKRTKDAKSQSLFVATYV